MATPSPSWTSLAYKVVSEASAVGPPATRVLVSLPSFLTRGASPLEIARNTQASPSYVDALLKDLSSYSIVEAQPSNVPFGSLYSLTSEGVPFFTHVQSLLASPSSVSTGR